MREEDDVGAGRIRIPIGAKGLDRAVSSGAITVDDAAAYGATLRRALPVARGLPPLRAQELRAVLHDVAGLQRAYTTPQRALVLFSTLAENEDWLAGHRLPKSGTDVAGEDGLVYRYFPGHGLVFHPLAEFAELNRLVSAGENDQASYAVPAPYAAGTSVAHGSPAADAELSLAPAEPAPNAPGIGSVQTCVLIAAAVGGATVRL